MKAVNVYFEDAEIIELEEAKGIRSWHDFFMELLIAHKAKINKPIKKG